MLSIPFISACLLLANSLVFPFNASLIDHHCGDWRTYEARSHGIARFNSNEPTRCRDIAASIPVLIDHTEAVGSVEDSSEFNGEVRLFRSGILDFLITEPLIPRTWRDNTAVLKAIHEQIVLYDGNDYHRDAESGIVNGTTVLFRVPGRQYAFKDTLGGHTESSGGQGFIGDGIPKQSGIFDSADHINLFLLEEPRHRNYRISDLENLAPLKRTDNCASFRVGNSYLIVCRYSDAVRPPDSNQGRSG